MCAILLIQYFFSLGRGAGVFGCVYMYTCVFCLCAWAYASMRVRVCMCVWLRLPTVYAKMSRRIHSRQIQ